MKLIRRIWRVYLRPWWYDYEWPVIGCIAVTVVVLGCVGFAIQLAKEGTPVEGVDLVFKSFQLFVLQIGVDPPMPWQLNVARVLAPLVAGYTALQALGHLLADQFQSFRLHFLRRHVVICGLGRKGLILAREFLKRGQAVVVIEEDAENDHVAQCRELGGVVLIGDAADREMLRKARVVRAKNLFALCGDDGLNAEIALLVEGMVKDRVNDPLICVMHIFDVHLCTLLHERELDASLARGIQREFFNTFDVGARVLLEKHPVAPPENHCPSRPGRMVIVGVGRLGESLLVTAARQWPREAAANGLRLHVTLVDLNASAIADKLRVRYPSLERRCQIEALDMDVGSAAFQQADFLTSSEQDGSPTRVFVCLDDDSVCLSSALALVCRGREHNPTIVVRMAQDAGLAVLLRDVESTGGSFRHLCAFGLLDVTCTPERVLCGIHEILARAIHEKYLGQQLAAGVTREQNPSLVPWSELPDDFRSSNLGQAYHIGDKLKEVRCSAAPQLDWDEPLLEFHPEEIAVLARMEHDRWIKEKQAQGWRYGPKKSLEDKTNPCMVPFDDLTPEQQELDVDTVRHIPGLLAKVGFRVHRMAVPTKDGEADRMAKGADSESCLCGGVSRGNEAGR